MKPTVRVRFAPSPTGHLHIGGVRTAFFNWLFARHYNGAYLVRIEDTDKARSTEAFKQSQLECFSWLGLVPDEEPIIQSERIDRHKEAIQVLADQGRAYYKEGAWWFAVDRSFDTETFHDAIRGPITISLDTIDDFVICRSDGTPIYNFCVVVDDHDMCITHVIRGEDHIANTFKQQLIYKALGWQVPVFAHLPLIVNDEGSPFSKRDGVTDTARYRSMGYLPEALLNYLVRLGWAHKDQEIFSREELIALFSLEGIGKKATFFDSAKLDWLNQHYIKNSSADFLYDYLKKQKEYGYDVSLYAPFSSEQVLRVIDAYKERTVTLHELHQLICSFAQVPQEYQEKERFAADKEKLIPLLTECAQRLNETLYAHPDRVKEYLQSFISHHKIKLGTIGQPLRCALTGSLQSPSIFDLISLLPLEEVRRRIARFCTALDDTTISL